MSFEKILCSVSFCVVRKKHVHEKNISVQTIKKNPDELNGKKYEQIEQVFIAVDGEMNFAAQMANLV